MTASPKRAAEYIQRQTSLRPELALVLGSGYQDVSGLVEIQEEIAYERIPGFSAPSVPGHPGVLLVGHIARVPVFVLCGRRHFYEDGDMRAVTFPIRVLAECGIRAVLLTNAAGGIATRLKPGDLMCLTDHINWMGENPLRGVRMENQSPFVDLSEVYDRALLKLMRKASRAAAVGLRFGIYLAVSGPSYETPAEIRAFARLGADAVGMSTVPEAIVARQCGIRVAGLSLITNYAAGRKAGTLSHKEVMEIGEKNRGKLSRLLLQFVREYGRSQGGVSSKLF